MGSMLRPVLAFCPDVLGLSVWHEVQDGVHERQLPAELYADMRERTPQAVLRDLYRPVREFYMTPEEVEGTGLRGLLRDAYGLLRAAQSRDELPHVDSLLRDVVEAQQRRRKLMAERWLPVKEEPRNQAKGK